MVPRLMPPRALPAVVLALAALAAALAGCMHRQAAAPDAAPRDVIELVESAPLETTLDHADIPDASDVWVAMIDRATRAIDFAEFYASDRPAAERSASKLAPVLDAVARAVKRRVRVRFVTDAVFAPKYPETLAELRAAGADVRILDFAKQGGGGVLHAKYFVVDELEAFIGSQNFDWRALAHIQEMGVHVTSPAIAGALADVFATDWELAAGRGIALSRVHRHPLADVTTAGGEHVSLVLSPHGFLPDEASWELPKLEAMLDAARSTIELQVLTYKTKERDGTPFPTLDAALRRAAQRGVHVRLIVSSWSSKPGSEARAALDALAAAPNVEIRIITIPAHSSGDIPFARVAHAKYLVVDAAAAWVGSSNWEGDYFTRTRNAGVVVRGGKLPGRLGGVFEESWRGPYVAPLAPVTGGAGAPPSGSDPARP
ncbi:MAG: Phospholipase D/Transphosphatidylase precursor [Labilithrix sp.]|nr:Phospholipase D/Transphosphatidylase precursor [Labilithrix sp.]